MEETRTESSEPEQVEVPLETREIDSPSESIAELEEKLKHAEVTINKLQDELRGKTDFATELQKHKTNLENEVVQLRSQNKNVYESSVIKFATAEKSILDAKNAREAAEKQTAKLQVIIENNLHDKIMRN